MDDQYLINRLANEEAQVEEALTRRVGDSSLCEIGKKGQAPPSVKSLEGQLITLRGAISRLEAGAGHEGLLQHLGSEEDKGEKMAKGLLGTSADWQEYLQGVGMALARIRELMAQ